MLRNGLSYQQASANSNKIAKMAYDMAIKAGATQEVAQSKSNAAYEKEMAWYESGNKNNKVYW